MPILTRREVRAQIVTRREVADMLNLHPDSISRALHDRLGVAVLEWGGAGKEMKFSAALVQSWNLARSCWSRDGQPCAICSLCLEDYAVVARHLIESRHGVLTGCADRDAEGPLCCGYPTGVGAACRMR